MPLPSQKVFDVFLHGIISCKDKANRPSVGKSTKRRVLPSPVRDHVHGLLAKGVQRALSVFKQITTFDPAISSLKICSKETTWKVSKVI